MLKNVEKATGMALENDGLIGGTNPIISPGLPWENQENETKGNDNCVRPYPFSKT